MICCASVDAIKDNQIHVAFDGWRGAFDYWTRYDSPDIFPVGWCRRSGHPIQPPGHRNNKIDASNKRRSIKPSNTLIHELIALPSQPSRPFITYLHNKCRFGPYINQEGLHATTTGPSYKLLAKLLLDELFNNCNNTALLEERLNNPDGEAYIINLADKIFTVKIPLEKNSTNVEMAKFLELMCSACEACPKLITLEEGPDECDNCLKQREKENTKSKPAITKDKRPSNGSNRHEENINGNSTKQQQIKFANQTPKLVTDVNSAEKAKRPLQPSKRRRPSDADTESSTSLSSTSSGTIQHFSKMPKKNIDNSVSVSTETTTMQAQTITTTSISSKLKQ